MQVLTYHERPTLLQEIPEHGHVVIEASAGTGKTYTIEHMVIDLLLGSRCTIDQILVVTFTVRATHELKLRIRQTLERLIHGGSMEVPKGPHWSIDDDARHHLMQALTQFDTASIRTIHSFCQQVLIDHAFACGRPFEQTVVDGRSVFSRAFRTALRDHLARDENHRLLLSYWLAASSVDALEELLFDNHAQRGELRPHIGSDRLERMLDVAERLRLLLAQDGVVQAITENYGNLPGLSFKDKEPIRDGLPKVIAALLGFRRQKWGELLAALHETSLESLARPRFRHDIVDDRIPEPVQAFALGLRELEEVLFPLGAAAVQWFLPVVREELRRLKVREGFLDHEDMLQAVEDALSSEQGPALVHSIRERYWFGLIDEFQDTDILQWGVFERLFVRPEGPGPHRHRLFIIGDPKQAIYSFRGGDIFTYLRAREVLSEGREPLHLVDNYRATAAMTEAYNLIFEQDDDALFTGDIRYDDPVLCARPGLNLIDGEGNAAPPVHILWVGSRSRSLKANSLRDRLGRAIAREIRELLSADLVLQDGESRTPLAAKDIFILTRTNPESTAIAEHLRREGVAYAFFKRDGLFQSPGARDVRDLLFAIDRPTDRSARKKAWLTPFFAVPLRDLGACDELDDTHPLVARLFSWHELAVARRYEQLFPRIISESGIVRRQIFYSHSERELTNTLHIFELLLDEASRSRGTLSEFIAQLDATIEGRRRPPGADGNIQRLDSEREAVQIMTIHKSKGLEASVVFVYGSFTSGSARPPYVYHERAPEISNETVPQDPEMHWETPGVAEPEASTVTRVISLELPRDEEGRRRYEQEEREESQRLLYVALTRAKARLYLPYYTLEEVNPLSREYFQNSVYEELRRRLEHLFGDRAHDAACARLFQVHDIPEGGEHRRQGQAPGVPWSPPEALLRIPPIRPIPLHHRRLVVTSYSRMKATDKHRDDDAPDVEAPVRTEVALPRDAVPPGAAGGTFLHDLLERVPFASLGSQDDGALGACRPELGDWLESEPIASLFADAIARHGMPPRSLDSAARMVYGVLTTPLWLDVEAVLPPLIEASWQVPEVEFCYPIPEHSHPPLGASTAYTPGELAGLTIERGWVKGFIDLVAELDGRIYILDWKSDLLPSYDRGELAVHIEKFYSWQVKLYTLAAIKLFGIADEAAFEARFGGMLYLFLRAFDGVPEPGAGVHVTSPSWPEVVAWDAELRSAGAI